MSAKIKEFWEKAKGIFLKLNKKVRLLICGSLVVLLAIAIVATIALNTKSYVVLFTGLSSDEASDIITFLKESGMTNYRLEGADTITVPEGMEAQLKANLLMQGYPKSGYAYDTYRSAINTMSTESDRTIALLQDLQDRMAAVIRCFDGVKSAVVNIVAQEDSRYILDKNSMTKAKASVMVTMDGSANLSQEQADAIMNLVAHSVQGLEIDDITVSDNHSNIFVPSDGAGSASGSSQLKLQLEDQVNRSTRGKILEVLAPIYGENNLRISVNSVVDVTHTVGESTSFELPEYAADGSTGGRGIIGTEVFDNELTRGEGNTAGGAAGTTTNADVPTYPNANLQDNNNDPYVRQSGDVTYDTNTKKEQTERRAGVITDLTVAVTINSESGAGVNIDNLTTHIASASGIVREMQGEKISILSSPFYTEQAPGGILPNAGNLPFQTWILYAAAGGLALLLLVLFLILAVRKKRKKQLSEEFNSLLDDHMSPLTAQAEPAGVDIMTIKTEKSMELRKTIRQFAEENPEIAAYMLKNWLKGEDEQRA